MQQYNIMDQLVWIKIQFKSYPMFEFRALDLFNFGERIYFMLIQQQWIALSVSTGNNSLLKWFRFE